MSSACRLLCRVRSRNRDSTGSSGSHFLQLPNCCTTNWRHSAALEPSKHTRSKRHKSLGASKHVDKTLDPAARAPRRCCCAAGCHPRPLRINKHRRHLNPQDLQILQQTHQDGAAAQLDPLHDLRRQVHRLRRAVIEAPQPILDAEDLHLINGSSSAAGDLHEAPLSSSSAPLQHHADSRVAAVRMNAAQLPTATRQMLQARCSAAAESGGSSSGNTRTNVNVNIGNACAQTHLVQRHSIVGERVHDVLHHVVQPRAQAATRHDCRCHLRARSVHQGTRDRPLRIAHGSNDRDCFSVCTCTRTVTSTSSGGRGDVMPADSMRGQVHAPTLSGSKYMSRRGPDRTA